MIDPAYMSAFAALIGTFVGGITSIATSWLGTHRQTKEERKARIMAELRALYKEFIHEASMLYVDALEHEETETSKLVNLHAILNQICILSSPDVIAEADKVLRTIIHTYAHPNKKFSDLMMAMDEGLPDPLRKFSEACHKELRAY